MGNSYFINNNIKSKNYYELQKQLNELYRIKKVKLSQYHNQIINKLILITSNIDIEKMNFKEIKENTT